MARRDGTKGTRNSGNPKVRRCGVVLGGAVGAFVAAAAMATGSAAPAKADIDDFLDPIIQPILTQVTDSISGFDPTLATDLTTWTDTFLADLNSLDSATAAASTAATSAASTSDAAASTPTGGDIPITIEEDTEPTVQATVDGANTTLLVDTGSSGLVIPSDDLNFLQLLELGFPSSFGISGYSGGVEYVYLTYDNVAVDYGNGAVDTTNTPVDLEIFSWPTSATSPPNFDAFDLDNGVTGILGIGNSADDAGPTGSPLEAAGFNGVTVNINSAGTGGELIVSPSTTNPGTAYATLDGAPTPTSNLTEVVTDGNTVVGTAQVSDDIDSGGVYGTIPSSIDPNTLAQGDVVTVKDGDTVLYSYIVGTDSDNTDEAPLVTSGTSIDSGIEPFLGHPIFIDYPDDTLSFDDPLA